MTDLRERPAATAAGGTIPAGPDGNRSRPAKAYELTDPRGRRALAWWTPEGWTVEAADPAFRRRVKRALGKSLWTRQDAIGPDGIRSSYLVQLAPTDPRYLLEIPLRWFQIGLGDLDVRVVRLGEHDRTVPPGNGVLREIQAEPA
jgi:hypothetical protein